MAASETSICNLALAHLGQNAIMDLADNSQAARFCKQYYEQTRDEVLQGHRWNFAMKRASLAQLANGPQSEWAFQYQLPIDCLRVAQLNGYSLTERPGLYSVEGQALLTDDEEANVRYIARIADPNMFPPLFVEALSVKLAYRLCVPLTGSKTQASDLLTEYERVTGPKARRVDAFEGRPKTKQPWVQSDLVASRYTG